MADKGQFDAYVLAWSGRADPVVNIFCFDACTQPLNYAGYCRTAVDELLNKTRSTRCCVLENRAFAIILILGMIIPILGMVNRADVWSFNAYANAPPASRFFCILFTDTRCASS